jgi:hypothetical protein
MPSGLNYEAAQPFYQVVQSSYGYPWQVERRGCVRPGYVEPTFAVYPVCENPNTLISVSKMYSVLFWDINQATMTLANTFVLNDWIQTENQTHRGYSFQIAGAISSDMPVSQIHLVMGQRLLKTLEQIAQQTSHPATVTVQVSVRGISQFRCSVNLMDVQASGGCLSQVRTYPSTYSVMKFYIDRVTIAW